MTPWRPARPDHYAERTYQPDTLKVSIADLVEQLRIARSERDEARSQYQQSERRRELLMDELSRVRALLLRQIHRRTRKPPLPDERQLRSL